MRSVENGRLRTWLFGLVLLAISMAVSAFFVTVLDVHEHDAIVLVAVIGAAASLVNTQLIRSTRRQVQEQIQPSNGQRIADLVESIADRSMRHETKLDTIEVQVRETRQEVTEMRQTGTKALIEHVSDTAPVIEFVRSLMPEDSGSET